MRTGNLLNRLTFSLSRIKGREQDPNPWQGGDEDGIYAGTTTVQVRGIEGKIALIISCPLTKALVLDIDRWRSSLMDVLPHPLDPVLGTKRRSLPAYLRYLDR